MIRSRLIAASIACAAGLAAADRQPNIVFILLDDLGARDAGFAGSRYYETPRMDRLAGEGMVFSQAYASSPNCAPTRAALMSGQVAPRTGIYNVGLRPRGPAEARKMEPPQNRIELDPQVVTWAERLRDNGYATAFVGKWHLGGTPETLPTGQGFLLNIAGSERGHQRSYFSPYNMPNITNGPVGENLNDRLADEAAGFIRDNASQPFCLYFAQYAVHTPIQSKPELAKRFADRKADGEQGNAEYAGLLYGADQAVGRVLDELERQNLADNTVVIVTSDNGGVQGITGQEPLRGYKGMLYEGGVRVPMIVRWPGRAAAGSTCDTPVATIDFYPTFLELSGTKPEPQQQLDGESLVPLMRGTGALKRDALFWHFPFYLEAGKGGKGPFRTTPVGSIRVGNLKLMEFFEDGRKELYDLANDPGESKDLAASRPEDAERLHLRMLAWRQETGAAMPIQISGK